MEHNLIFFSHTVVVSIARVSLYNIELLKQQP